MNLTALLVIVILSYATCIQYPNVTVDTEVTITLPRNEQTIFVVFVPPLYRSYITAVLQSQDTATVAMYQSRNYAGNSTLYDNQLAQPNNGTKLVLTLEPSITTNAIYFIGTYTGTENSTTISFILDTSDVLVFKPNWGTIKVDLNGDYAYYEYTKFLCDGRYTATASCPDEVEIGINAVDFRAADSIPEIGNNPSVELVSANRSSHIFVRLRAAPGSCIVGVNCRQVTLTVTEHCPYRPNPGAIIGGVVGACGVLFCIIIPGIIMILMYYGVIKTPEVVADLVKHLKAEKRQQRIDKIQSESIVGDDDD